MHTRFSRFTRPRQFFRFNDLPVFLMEGEGGGGGGTSEKPKPSDLVNQYGGDTIRMAERLASVLGDNFDYREKIRVKDARISELEKVAPGADVVVLPKAKAELLEKYEKFGTPEVLTTELETGRSARTKVAEVEKTATLEKAAKVAGLKSGLLKIVGRDLPITVREVEIADAEGKTSKVERAFIVGKNGDAETLTPLADHFKAQGEDVLQSLLDTDSGNQNGQAGGSLSQGGGIQYPAQSAVNNGNQAPTSYAAGLYEQHNAPVAK